MVYISCYVKLSVYKLCAGLVATNNKIMQLLFVFSFRTRHLKLASDVVKKFPK